MPVAVVPAGLFVAALWGLQPTLHKVLLRNIGRHTVLVLGSVFYTLCNAAYAYWHRAAIARDVRSGHLTGRALAAIAAGSVLCGFLANVVYFAALRGHASYVVSALVYSAPVFTLLGAYLFTRERASAAAFAGVLLVAAGVALLALHEAREGLLAV